MAIPHKRRSRTGTGEDEGRNRMMEEEKMQDTMIRATNNVGLTNKDLLEANKRNGLMGVYDLGMQHMYEYLKDAEEKGLLLKLPYPVGTPIYHVFKSQGVVRDRIRSWRYVGNGLLFCTRGNSLVPEAIGKSVFLTRAEAEKAWEKMKGE